MDQKQIEEIVRSVMASMGQAAPAPSEAKCATTTCAAPVTSESCAPGFRLCGSKSVDWRWKTRIAQTY
ncbi:Ethanolamine ammonia-lyase light chain [Escherichia coli]|uniref:Ethanolamine ammonia-lyase light chain n=1 Tax=Escherichia coli TaxID=562 RepID=A0A447X1P6_ECOLX|nr:Ethanolamine ammonia-lyase light chain [Escherichia coli]